MKSRYRRTTKPDVCLSPGWSYFVETTKYADHYTKFASQDEISNCVNHRAVGQADLKRHKGLSATGIVACSCRHECFRANGVGDLQRGERYFALLLLSLFSDNELYRYCNVDYVLMSSLIGFALLYLLATNDIACQYFTNFWARMLALPSRLRLKIPRINLSAKVPKAHLEVHQMSCHGPFSLNFTFGAGQTDGEGVERLWSWLNKAAPSVKEMGASSDETSTRPCSSF